MSTLAVCPRCHCKLAGTEFEPSRLQCPECDGFLVQGEPSTVATPTGETDLEATRCPACLLAMVDVPGETSAFACPACGGRWTDGPASAPTAAVSDAAVEAAVVSEPPAMSPTLQKLLYGVSLPERILRGAVGLTAGAATELASVIVPQAFQSSKSYEIAIKNSLGFLTETVGGIRRSGTETENDEAEAAEHIARKAVGNFIDMAGLATLHVSPMWILAVVSDVCYGTKTYVREVADELQRQGVIDDASSVHNVDDVLDAIQRASGTAASSFDKPPLSVEQLRQTITETRQAVGEVNVRKLIPESELRSYWSEMEQAASAEGVSLMQVSSAITLSTMNRAKTVSQGTLTSIRVAGGLFNRAVLSHYRDSLDKVRQRGLIASISDSYGPYVTGVWENLSSERKSWTETLLDPTNISRGVDKVWKFLGGDQPAEA